MPEGPELYKNSQFVNKVCKGLVFSGKIVKSAVSTKNPDVSFPAMCDYCITSESRGKETALILTSLGSDGNGKQIKQENDCEKQRLRILFRFGMSGKFTFGAVKDMHKHAHLNFFTKEKPVMVLSFVDVRRFGRWEVTDEWSNNRGPDPMFEYQEFRSNILDNLQETVFNKPLCEVMHNQKYFNGIGNYLRAEIIFRAAVPPFSSARSVLEKLKVNEEESMSKVSKGKKCKVKHPDFLELCNLVPKEVINLPYDPTGNYSDYSAFNEWRQCYYKPEMRNIVDHDGRTIWFKGEAGPLVPKDAKSRGMRTSKKRKTEKVKKEINGDEETKAVSEDHAPPKKKKKKTKTPPKATVKKEPKKKTVVGKESRKKRSSGKQQNAPVRRSLRLNKDIRK